MRDDKIYQSLLDEFDLAGFAVGAVERNALLPKLSEMREGDVVLGLGSSGPHSNGFSLIRKVVSKHNLKYTGPCPWDSTTTLGESLLTPTKIYVKPLLLAVNNGIIKGMAHITGGGFIENIPRALPEHLDAIIDATTWPIPKVFKWLANFGNIASGIGVT